MTAAISPRYCALQLPPPTTNTYIWDCNFGLISASTFPASRASNTPPSRPVFAARSGARAWMPFQLSGPPKMPAGTSAGSIQTPTVCTPCASGELPCFLCVFACCAAAKLNFCRASEFSWLLHSNANAPPVSLSKPRSVTRTSAGSPVRHIQFCRSQSILSALVDIAQSPKDAKKLGKRQITTLDDIKKRHAKMGLELSKKKNLCCAGSK